MTWREFYHWLTTSRYTRRLEAEIEQLKADNASLRHDNEELLKALYPAIRAARQEPIPASNTGTLKKGFY